MRNTRRDYRVCSRVPPYPFERRIKGVPISVIGEKWEYSFLTSNVVVTYRGQIPKDRFGRDNLNERHSSKNNCRQLNRQSPHSPALPAEKATDCRQSDGEENQSNRCERRQI